MSDQNRAYDPDRYFGKAAPDEVPDTKAEAARRLREAVGYARLHAPELLHAPEKPPLGPWRVLEGCECALCVAGATPARCAHSSKYGRHLTCNNELPCDNPDHRRT